MSLKLKFFLIMKALQDAYEDNKNWIKYPKYSINTYNTTSIKQKIIDCFKNIS